MRFEPTHPRPRRFVARALVLALASASLAGCGEGCACSGSEPVAQPGAPTPAPLTQPATEPPPQQPEPPAEPTAEAVPAVDRLTKPGWSKVTVDEQVPICVFSNFVAHEEPKFLKDVKKQRLEADSTLVIGAFGPWCVNEGCDDLPSLQCSIERSGDILRVRTHYWGYRKDGSRCGGPCRQVTAGCETPKLEAGTYTIEHGTQTYKLKIPSTLKSPCFGKELPPPS
jgi:hypothetical protein